MSLPPELLAQEVLRLPAAERSRLLDRVIASLDQEAARASAWDQLAAERDRELDSDASRAVPGDQVLAALQAQLS